jgi:hypothetical protein
MNFLGFSDTYDPWPFMRARIIRARIRPPFPASAPFSNQWAAFLCVLVTFTAFFFSQFPNEIERTSMIQAEDVRPTPIPAFMAVLILSGGTGAGTGLDISYI